MSEIETCPVEKWDGWHTRKCGRPIKRDGMCGIHAGAKDRAEAQRQKKADERSQREARSEVIVGRLRAHGIGASVGYDGRVSLPGAGLIADQLDAQYRHKYRGGGR